MDEFDEAIDSLKKNSVQITHGLTSGELDKVENFYGIEFHPDHKKMIQSGLFLGDRGYNWRDFSKENTAKIKRMLNWPLEGILFDIENGSYWNNNLGEKPTDLTESKKMFSLWYKQNVPQLIPIYSHRYMSGKPTDVGAPVYSVYQTDVVYYGQNIFDYLVKEFKINTDIKYPKWEKDSTPFWSEIIS